MSDFGVLRDGSERDDVEQEQLNLAWNAFLQGETDALDTLEPQDAAVIDHLYLLTGVAQPRSDFTNQLKEQLMEVSVSSAGIPIYGEKSPSISTKSRPVAPLRGVRRWWHNSLHVLGAIATVALVAVSLFGGYLAISSLNRGGSDQPGLPGFAAIGTPTASPVPCDECDKYLPPSTSPVEVMGHGFINMGDLSENQQAATMVQLQDWILDPATTTQVAPDTTNGMTGVVVDVVIDGAGLVTIDAPAVLSKRVRPAYSPSQTVYYLKAGETTALGPGDVISYPAGHARTLENPLPQTALHIKSAVFYSGDIEPTAPTVADLNGLHVEIDGSAVLGRTLNEYGTSEVDVELDYIQIRDGAPLPDYRYDNNRVDRVLGPVDPVQPNSGYVLWLGASLP